MASPVDRLMVDVLFRMEETVFEKVELESSFDGSKGCFDDDGVVPVYFGQCVRGFEESTSFPELE